MPVPPPAAADVKDHPPTAAEVELLGRGVVAAVAPASGLTEMQGLLIDAVFHAMTGHHVVFGLPPLSAEETALALAGRTIEFRTRIVQIMVLCALVLRPLPADVADRVADYARELSVEEGMLAITREFAAGTLGLAAMDFERNGYTSTWADADAEALHTSAALTQAWEAVEHDPGLAARWRALEGLPAGTLGRRITDFYRARGFTYPGERGSAPPLLAQHDWVHVVADYGTTVEAELEVFAFIARANDDPHAFSLLAMVVSLFETGYLRQGAGLFQYDIGHLEREGMATRLADAMRRGAQCPGSNDFLRTDWFTLADLPVDEVRRRIGLPPKGQEALAAGSVGPWEPGGISPFQALAGADLATRDGRPYDTFGAVPLGSSAP